jgi:hypothetical protein
VKKESHCCQSARDPVGSASAATRIPASSPLATGPAMVAMSTAPMTRDNSRFEQFGNDMAIPVADWIGRPRSFAAAAPLLKLRRAMRAFCRFDRHCRQAVRTILGCGRSCRLRSLHSIDLPDEQKDHECDDQKIDDIVNEDTVIQGCSSGGFCGRDAGIIFAREVNEQIRKINIAQCQTNRRHQNILDKRSDDLAEGGAYDNADCQVDNVAPHDEFLEFFVHDSLLFSLKASRPTSMDKNSIQKSPVGSNAAGKTAYMSQENVKSNFFIAPADISATVQRPMSTVRRSPE